MFKVHNLLGIDYNHYRKFQNISCLRFIVVAFWSPKMDIEFQNISCLRFIIKSLPGISWFFEFQNISCLRFITVQI